MTQIAPASFVASRARAIRSSSFSDSTPTNTTSQFDADRPRATYGVFSASCDASISSSTPNNQTFAFGFTSSLSMSRLGGSSSFFFHFLAASLPKLSATTAAGAVIVKTPPRDASFVMEDLGMRTRASPRTISSSVSRRMVDSASRIVPEPSSTRARHFVSYPMTLSLQRGDDRRRRLSAEFATERAEIRVDGRGVAHEKTRNEAEDRIEN